MSRPPRGTARRAEQVITILMLEGLQMPLARMRIAHCASLRCRLHCTWQRWTGKYPSDRAWPDGIRRSLIRLGPAFVKIGQILSVRSDLVPAELAAALRSLQSEVPPPPFEQVRPIVEDQLGAPIDEAFATFESDPIGAGSLAVVYRAELVDGSRVAVKVKRPGIDEQVRRDLEILEWIAEQIERHVPEARPYRPMDIAAELRRYTLLELDFRNEAAVTSEVGAAFADRPDVLIPKVHHASEDLFVMDFVDCFPLDDTAAFAEHEIDAKALVRVGVELVLAQMFDLGLFHGDPHPGNVRVTPDGRLVMLDFGIFGRLDESLRRSCALTLWTLSQGEVRLTSFFLLQMATLSPGADVRAFRREIEQRYRGWRGASLEQYSIAQLAYEEFSLGGRHGVELPSELLLLGKALVTIEGAVLALNPDLDLSDEIAPYLEGVRERMFGVDRLRDQFLRSVPLWWDVFDRLPLVLAEAAERQMVAPLPEPTDDLESERRTQTHFVPASLVLGGSYVVGTSPASLAPPFQVVGMSLIGLGLAIWIVERLRASRR